MEYIPSFRDDLRSDIKPSFLSHAMTEEEVKAKKFGLPESKKFPMPDIAHVKSAIKFFNYVKPSQEQELANAILARIEEYGINPESINVGDGNRFKKYIEKTYLKHHGILGMHWGIRKYQNKDGSYTSKGKQHRNMNNSKRYQQNQQKLEKSKQERQRMINDAKVWDDIIDYPANESSKYEKPCNKAIDDYYNYYDEYGFDHPKTKEAYDKAWDISYKYGYDTGKKAAKKFSKDYDSETLNRVINKSLEEYFSRKEISAMGNDAVEKFAVWNGTYEQFHF